MAKKRWKNTELAKATKISPTAIGRYLNDERQPRIEQVIEIASVLDVNIDDLLLKDLSQEAGRPFGAEGEGQEPVDETLKRMNELLEQRLRQLEEEIKKENPARAKELGIK